MSSRPVPAPHRTPAALVLPCAGFAAVISLAVLCGWTFHLYRLLTLFPGLPAMAVPTALGFLLVSLSLVLQRIPAAPDETARFSVKSFPAILVIALGVGALIYFFASDNPTAVLTPPAIPLNAAPLINRTSPNAAVNFILLGLALFLLDIPWRKDGVRDGDDTVAEAPRWPYQVFALTVLLDAFFALLGQIYGVTLLYGVSRAIAMALPTAVLFLVSGFAILAARPERGFVAILLSNNVAGRAARRLLPVVIAVPLVVGGITLFGLHVAASFATYLLVVTSIGLLISLFWSTILTLHQQVERTVAFSQQVADQSIALERQNAALERAAMIVQQRQFVRDMLASVTEGKLRLCDVETDLSAPLPPASDEMELRTETLRVLRRHVMRVAEELQLSEQRAHDLLTAVGEASMNAVKHGGGGTARIHSDAVRGVIQVWVRDAGAGIRDEDLSRATLEKGWSGAGSFGHGFYLMLRTADRTYLLTGANGTTVVLEQERTTPQPAWLESSGSTLGS